MWRALRGGQSRAGVAKTPSRRLAPRSKHYLMHNIQLLMTSEKLEQNNTYGRVQGTPFHTCISLEVIVLAEQGEAAGVGFHRPGRAGV